MVEPFDHVLCISVPEPVRNQVAIDLLAALPTAPELPLDPAEEGRGNG